MSSIRTAILTISDTASLDHGKDQSGPTIRGMLLESKCSVLDLLVVPDEIQEIQAAIKRWCSLGEVDWIITTGGTGFGRRDTTPEAVSPLLDRQAPGLVHLMLATSLTKTPMAALSRPVAGTIGSTLIVTLPGSVKAVRENLEALLAGGVVFHALDLIRGGTGTKVHQKMATGAAVQVDSLDEVVHKHSHEHHHDRHHHHGHAAPTPRTILSNDPSLPASARQRESPYPLLAFDDAINMVLNQVQPLTTLEAPVHPDLAGHVLAEDVYAPGDVPASQTTSVDGYALRSSDPPGVYTVLTPSTHALSLPLPQGSIFRINTGAPLPHGADAVIMVEDTRVAGVTKDASGADDEEESVETLAQVDVGENVRAPGSDVRKGEMVLAMGEVLGSVGGEIGTLAFVGRKNVKVHKRPVVAILSTGNELVDLQSPQPQSSDGWGGIFDTNRPSLQAALEGLGYTVLDLGIVPDDEKTLVDALRRGVDGADLVLTTGGTSMGVTDLLKPVIERAFDGTVHFGRVRVKPGKPTTFASLPAPASRAGTSPNAAPTPVFALPGNPASALVMFYVFVLPALRRLGGWALERCQLPRVQVQLQDPMSLDPRPEFHRVVIKAGKDGLRAYSTGGQRSSRVASLKGANGLVALPGRAKDGPSRLEKGVMVGAVVVGELHMY